MATLIGSPTYSASGSASPSLSTNPTVTVTVAGQSIVAWLYQSDSLTRTFTVTSDLDGALTQAGYYNPGAALGVWVLHDATVGTHTISPVGSAGGVNFGFGVQVIETLGRATPQTDTQFATSNGLSHVTGGTGVTTSTSTFALCVCALSGGVTTKVPGSGYTELAGPPASGARYAQYRDFASGVTAEQGAFTTTGTNRANRGLLVAFPVAASGGGGSASGGAFISWFGR